MGVATFRSGITRATLTILAALAIAYSVLVPQGFMTTRGADGRLLVVICTGHGPVASMAMPGMDMGHDKSGHDGGKSDMQCPFASHAAPSAPVEPAYQLADLPLDYPPPPTLPLIAVAPGRGMPAPPPPSRAPPRLVA